MRRNFWLFGGGLLVLVSVLTSCVGGSSLVKESSRLTLATSDDGFAFANFGSSDTAEVFDGSDLAAMFGGIACVDGVSEPCIPTAEAASWAQMVNQARASGHCEGIVVQAAARYNNNEMPKTVQLTKDSDVDHAIMRAFATQFLPEVREETNGWQKRSLEEILGALGDSFRGLTVESASLFGSRTNSSLISLGSAEYTMGLYTEAGGHAVLPYAIEFPDDDTAIIFVYDSNWPGRSDRYVRVDLDTGEWFFSFSGQDPNNDPCQWTGKRGDMDLTSLSTRTNATVPFGDGSQTVKGSMLVIRAQAGNWSVKTDAGTYSPADGVEVEGVTASSIKAASVACGKPALTEYTVYTNDPNVELNLPDAASVYVVNDGGITQVQTDGQSDTNPISITNKKISVKDAKVKLKVATSNLVAEATSANTIITIGDSLNVDVTSLDGTNFIQIVDNDVPQAQINASGTDANNKIVVTTQNSNNVTTQTNISSDGTKTVINDSTISLDLNNVVSSLDPSLSINNKTAIVNNNIIVSQDPGVSTTPMSTVPSRGMTWDSNLNKFVPVGSGTTTTSSSTIAGAPSVPTGSTMPSDYCPTGWTVEDYGKSFRVNQLCDARVTAIWWNSDIEGGPGFKNETKSGTQIDFSGPTEFWAVGGVNFSFYSFVQKGCFLGPPPCDYSGPPTTQKPVYATLPPTTLYVGPVRRAGETYRSGQCEEWKPDNPDGSSGTIRGTILWTYTGNGDEAVYTSCIPG
jgi:hypothetical protein